MHEVYNNLLLFPLMFDTSPPVDIISTAQDWVRGALHEMVYTGFTRWWTDPSQYYVKVLHSGVSEFRSISASRGGPENSRFFRVSIIYCIPSPSTTLWKLNDGPTDQYCIHARVFGIP